MTVATLDQSSDRPVCIVGSGWWSSDREFAEEFPDRKELGDPSIRSVPFFEIWLKSVRAAIAASDIVVVDSAAPQKPSAELRAEVRWIELPFNAQHSTNHLGRWSGWTRSVLVSGNYALASDCDFFVYVEQDCLLKGAEIVSRCTDSGSFDLMFGSGEGTPQPLQQSFFIIRGRALGAFLSNLAALRYDDCKMAPEWKFVWSSWRPLVVLANWGVFRFKLTRKLGFWFARGRFFGFLPVGSGRARPVPFESSHYYFQHGSVDEIDVVTRELSS